MTIYSIRTDMGRELYWTTSRKKALELAAQLTEPGNWVNGSHIGGYDARRGLSAHDLPVAVYKSSVIHDRR